MVDCRRVGEPRFCKQSLDFIGGHHIVAKRLFFGFGSSLRHFRNSELFLDCRNVCLVLAENFLFIGNARALCFDRLRNGTGSSLWLSSGTGSGLRLSSGSALKSRRAGIEQLLEIFESLFVCNIVALEFHPIAVIRRHSARFSGDIHNVVLFKTDRRKRNSCKRCVVLKNTARKEEIYIGNRNRTVYGREHLLFVFREYSVVHLVVG